MNQPPLTIILAATLGAGALFAILPPLPPQACEPIELVRFVGPQPEIHVVQATTWGRGSDDWLQQYEDAQDEGEPDTVVRRRRRHGR